MNALRLSLEEVEVFERTVPFRIPFRFGVVTVEEAPQVFVRVRVGMSDGRSGQGATAELLAPKWFDKDPALSHAQNFEQLHAAIRKAAPAYRKQGSATPFELSRRGLQARLSEEGDEGEKPLVTGFGPAQLDKAILDAVCRLEGVSFFEAIRTNRLGIELPGRDSSVILASWKPSSEIEARHTVGGVDPIRGAGTRARDGLPETLTEVLDAYGNRYFKIKVGAGASADRERLIEIASVLDERGRYFVTLDGNEQLADVAAVEDLLETLETEPRLRRLREAVLYLEQPFPRDRALSIDVSRISARIPVIIDESDDRPDAFERAIALGYRGTSSKSCKGLYKSIVNAVKCREAGSQYFLSGEDLTTQPGLAIQQDLALASVLGLRQVERNGHHYVGGFGVAPEDEAQRFLAAHPDLYEERGGVRLRIREGRLSIGSLDVPGFASGAWPDFDSMVRVGTY
ncbi:MAG: enolase C-terminal domain-like protein [Planctomycetota bacterium]